MAQSVKMSGGAIKYAKKHTPYALADISKGVDEAQPYLQQGVDTYGAAQGKFEPGVDMYNNSLGLNGQAGYDAAVGAYQHSPGYDFALNEANQNVLRNAAATGGVLSGQTGIDLSERARDLQNLDFGNWQDRLQGMINPYMMGTSGKAGALTNLGKLFEGEGINRAGTRMQGIGMVTSAIQNQARMQAEQEARKAAEDQQWMSFLNAGIGGLSGFLGA